MQEVFCYAGSFYAASVFISSKLAYLSLSELEDAVGELYIYRFENDNGIKNTEGIVRDSLGVYN